MPLISVIIPLYNHEHYIEEAVSSVLGQTFTDFELIIINDGSTDTSESVVERFSDNRINYIYQSNKGAHNAINRGIDIATGKYISILNSDDVYHQSRLEECYKVLHEKQSVHAVFSGIEYIDETGKCINTTIGAEENWLNRNAFDSFKSEANLTLDLLAGNFLKTTSNLFCRSDCFDTVGPFRNLRYAHDYDFFLKLSYSCNIEIIDRPLIKYRCHAENTLKESSAAADLECALVVSDFLLSHDLGTIVDAHDPLTLVKLFNSINAHRSDRIILFTLLFDHISHSGSTVPSTLIEKRDDLFWKIGLEYLENYHDGWQAREKIHNEWNKLHSLYLESEKERNSILQSKGYRAEKKIKNFILRIRNLLG